MRPVAPSQDGSTVLRFVRQRPTATLELPAGADENIEVFTTRPDTLFGATYMVLAPEHALVGKITTSEQRAEVERYVEAAARRSERARITDAKQKTGVFTGAMAAHPVTGVPLPSSISMVWPLTTLRPRSCGLAFNSEMRSRTLT